MNFLQTFWRWLMDLLGVEPRAIHVSGRVFMPLFYVNLSGRVDSTWDYLSKSFGEQKHCRAEIKRLAKPGEQAAIVFLLTPPDEAGLIFSPFPVLNDGNVKTAIAAIKALLKDDIAVFACLYADDRAPWWYNIYSHIEAGAWGRLHEKIGRYVTGYILSIETNEKAENVGQIERAIVSMKNAMPGAQFYGTHLQWKGKSEISNYRWQSQATTPNCDLILWEGSWDPHDGDAIGVDGLQREYRDVYSHIFVRLLWNEYNFNPAGETNRKQREYLREQKAWGVG